MQLQLQLQQSFWTRLRLACPRQAHFGRRFRTTLRCLHTQQTHGTGQGTNAPAYRAEESKERNPLDHLLRHRLFYTPSFEVYDGTGVTETKGLFDYGPPGCALQANLIDLWRRHFVLEEDMLELDCTSLTPHEVLKTSGHVEEFADWMCRDITTGETFRGDHLIKETLSRRLSRHRRYVAKEEDRAISSGEATQLRSARLADSVVQQYNEILAQVRRKPLSYLCISNLMPLPAR